MTEIQMMKTNNNVDMSTFSLVSGHITQKRKKCPKNGDCTATVVHLRCGGGRAHRECCHDTQCIEDT